MDALATENVPAQQSTTSPTDRVNLQMISNIYNMFFYSSETKTQDWMYCDQRGRLVHLAVDLGRFRIDFSIRDASILCCQARHSNHVRVKN